jgi:hypothetical protein
MEATVLSRLASLLPYWGVLLAAIVEGRDRLHRGGHAGGARAAHPSAGPSDRGPSARVGDQAWFYLFPRPPAALAARYPSIARKTRRSSAGCGGTAT